MAFDPQREDYMRLGLRYARSLDHASSAHATREFAAFGRKFAQDRDSLPQSDSDRAFHLVVLASKNIDYELPFADEARAQTLVEEAHHILDEAILLDSHCYDAIRMKAAATSPSFDSFLTFLNDGAAEVREYCTAQCQRIEDKEPGERQHIMKNLAMRPYVRWIATQAEEALICGRNRESVRLVREAIKIDPHDTADAYYTAALAYAKLEDEHGLEEFIELSHKMGRVRPPDDAWTRIAQLALAFKRHDLKQALTRIDELIATYPHAAEALIRQIELPDGVFARLAVAPYSEDEIILALSEGAVLLQEGVDLQGRGVLSSWVVEQAALKAPQAMLSVMAQSMPGEQQGPKDTRGGHQ